MEIEDLRKELVLCNNNCEGIKKNLKEGIIPRCMNLEKRNGKNNSIVVGHNPGKCKKEEKEYYLKNNLSPDSVQTFFEESELKQKPYFKRTRDLITKLGFEGDILWTDLAKCECSGKNGILPIQTLRVCINKFLRKEINIFKSQVIFALGNKAFNFCALSFPDHFIVGLYHPSGSYGDFHRLKNDVFNNTRKYVDLLSKRKDTKENIIAIHLSKFIEKKK